MKRPEDNEANIDELTNVGNPHYPTAYTLVLTDDLFEGERGRILTEVLNEVALAALAFDAWAV